MEDHVKETIQEFGIEFVRPEWWQFKIEDKAPECPTYLFWDEYTGSLRVTPSRVGNGFDLDTFLERRFQDAVGSGHVPEWREFNGRKTVCYVDDNPSSKTRIHFYIGGHDDILVACSFAYDSSSLDDELYADEVDGALEEVIATLNSMSIAPG